MTKAVFLDRDGVIIAEKNLLHRKEDVELLPRVVEAIKLLNQAEYKVIVVTNQPVIARGLCSLEETIEINEHMRKLLSAEGAVLDKIYFCPHHPTKGSNLNYTRECECRKPKPGMILQAQREFGIETLSQCFLIGDKTSDIKAGFLAGCKTILVETGYGGEDGFNDAVPDHKTNNLYSAVVDIILR